MNFQGNFNLFIWHVWDKVLYILKNQIIVKYLKISEYPH